MSQLVRYSDCTTSHCLFVVRQLYSFLAIDLFGNQNYIILAGNMTTHDFAMVFEATGPMAVALPRHHFIIGTLLLQEFHRTTRFWMLGCATMYRVCENAPMARDTELVGRLLKELYSQC